MPPPAADGRTSGAAPEQRSSQPASSSLARSRVLLAIALIALLVVAVLGLLGLP